MTTAAAQLESRPRRATPRTGRDGSRDMRFGPLGTRRVQVLGCQLDRVNLDEAIAVCEEVIRSRGYAQHMAVNVAKLVTMREDHELRASVAGAQLISADGQGVVWASRLLGNPLPSRVAGIDLMQALLERSARAGYRIYVLGATKAVLRRALDRMRRELPHLQLAGYQDGYYEDADEAQVAASIAAARPDILFVAMSSPRKEYFLARHGKRMGVPFVMGVGGAIDVYAGVHRRAPGLLQRLGLEWLFRLVQEPHRLLRRYARTNAVFAMLLARELVRVRVARGPQDTGTADDGVASGSSGCRADELIETSLVAR